MSAIWDGEIGQVKHATPNVAAELPQTQTHGRLADPALSEHLLAQKNYGFPNSTHFVGGYMFEITSVLILIS